MNIFKNKINRREYAYLNILLLVAFSYIYKFGYFDIHYLKNTVETQFIIPKIIFFVFAGISLFLSYIYLAIIRLNDTKISKWSLFALIIPYIGILYTLMLLIVPSKEQTDNNDLCNHILITSLLILLMNVLLFGLNSVTFGSIILILLFLFIIFVFDFLITNIAKLLKKLIKQKEN